MTVTPVSGASDEEMEIVLDLIGGNGASIVGRWEGNVKDCLLTGVDTVADDMEIRGLRSHIQAPAGAIVRTLSGVQTGTDNLIPGIYIVSYKGKTRKVVVK